MRSWSVVVRVMAVFLLLLTGAELFACELISPANCELAGSANGDGGSKSGDDCLCCCTHVVIERPVVFIPVELVSFEPGESPAVEPASQPQSIYHPPKF